MHFFVFSIFINVYMSLQGDSFIARTLILCFFLLINNNVKVLLFYIYLYTFNPTNSNWHKIALHYFFYFH